MCNSNISHITCRFVASYMEHQQYIVGKKNETSFNLNGHLTYSSFFMISDNDEYVTTITVTTMPKLKNDNA